MSEGDLQQVVECKNGDGSEQPEPEIGQTMLEVGMSRQPGDAEKREFGDNLHDEQREHEPEVVARLFIVGEVRAEVGQPIADAIDLIHEQQQRKDVARDVGRNRRMAKLGAERVGLLHGSSPAKTDCSVQCTLARLARVDLYQRRVRATA